MKYPEVYAELARQEKTKKELARVLNITANGLRYKQTAGDFTGNEMKITAEFLNRPASVLFDLGEDTKAG